MLTLVLTRAACDIPGPFEARRVVSTGRAVAEAQHHLLCGLDGLRLIFELQHLDSGAVSVEFHPLQLRRDIEEGLWAEMAKFPMVGRNMAEDVMAALMGHEEPSIGRVLGHRHGAHHDYGLLIGIDR